MARPGLFLRGIIPGTPLLNKTLEKNYVCLACIKAKVRKKRGTSTFFQKGRRGCGTFLVRGTCVVIYFLAHENKYLIIFPICATVKSNEMDSQLQGTGAFALPRILLSMTTSLSSSTQIWNQHIFHQNLDFIFPTYTLCSYKRLLADTIIEVPSECKTYRYVHAILFVERFTCALHQSAVARVLSSS